MKKLLLKTCTILCFVFFSCESDDSGNNQQEMMSESLSATIDGVSFNTDNISAILSNDGEQLVIIGSTSTETLRISLGTPFENELQVQEQTYTLDGSSVGTVQYVLNGEEFFNRVDISEGFITISNLNFSEKRISGSFSASVSNISDPDAILISNGIISNIEFTEQ